jgi:hypothetical protein
MLYAQLISDLKEIAERVLIRKAALPFVASPDR